MQERIANPAMTVPGAGEALQKLARAVQNAGVPAATLYMVAARASQINGCSVCLDIHTREMKDAEEADERIRLLSAWRETPYFTEAERAALALTEASTLLANRSDSVPNETWEEAARHHDEMQLAGLVLAIAEINTWNRINASTRQITGDWVEQWVRHADPAG